MDLSKFNGRGLSGLKNLGNTCFLNSCVQVLSHTYELHDILDNTCGRLNDCVDKRLMGEFNNLRNLLWSKNCSIAPGGFVLMVQKIAKHKDKDIFTGYAQNDLPEFLLFLIDSMHNCLTRPVDMKIKGNIENSKDETAVKCYKMMIDMYSKEYSEIIKSFYGIHVSEIKDPKTGKVLSAHPEPFFMIDVPIASKPGIVPSIYDCLDLYTEPEELKGENAWFNDKTNQTENLVTRNFTYWSLPDILIIDFKRFTNLLKKDDTLITFPLKDLNMSKYVSGYNKASYIYELYGICNHMGGHQGGHYTSFVKNSNGNWYHFNDINVSKVSNLATLVSSKAYCLFYRKKKIR